MKHIEINIGKACNNKCRFCMSSKNYIDDISLEGDGEKYGLAKFEDIKNQIISYSNKGFKSIGFLGGDVSIHPNLFEIIAAAKKNGFESINIITNGMIFSDFLKAKKLVLSGVTRVNISIHSHDSIIEDYITQIEGGFNKKLKAIDNFNLLHKEGLLKNPLSLNIVVNKLNHKSILKTCLYFNKIKNISDIRINFLWNRFFISKEDREIFELKYADFIPYLKQLITISLKGDFRITFDSIPACIFNKLGFKDSKTIIKKFLGEEFDNIEEVSNVNQNKIFDWKKQKKDDLKVKFDKCSDCSYNASCEGVRKEYFESFGNVEFNPVNN